MEAERNANDEKVSLTGSSVFVRLEIAKNDLRALAEGMRQSLGLDDCQVMQAFESVLLEMKSSLAQTLSLEITRAKCGDPAQNLAAALVAAAAGTGGGQARTAEKKSEEK